MGEERSKKEARLKGTSAPMRALSGLYDSTSKLDSPQQGFIAMSRTGQAGVGSKTGPGRKTGVFTS